MDSIKQLCSRVFLVNAGHLSEGANMLATIDEYVGSSLGHNLTTGSEGTNSLVNAMSVAAQLGPS